MRENIRVALAGESSKGKMSLLNTLTGKIECVGNWAGLFFNDASWIGRMMCFVGIGIIILVPLLITRIKTIYLSFISNVIFCIPESNKYRFWMSALCKIAVLRSFEVNMQVVFIFS